MKHIFTVHSHITYLAALGVITELNLEPEDCMIFSLTYSRDYPIRTHTLPKYSGFQKCLHICSIFNLANRIRTTVTRFTGNDKFIVYAPCMVREALVIGFHKNCVKRNLIEEGLSSYFDGFEYDRLAGYSSTREANLSFWARLQEAFSIGTDIMRGMTAKIQAMPLYYNSYANSPGVNFYCFNERAFPQCKWNKHVMSLEQTFRKFKVEKTLELNNTWLFLGEYQDKHQRIEDFLTGVEKGYLPMLKANHINHILIKHHPSETPGSRQALQELFRRNAIDYQIIPDSTILEFEMLNASGLNVGGFSSSLLVYAAIMGHRAMSVTRHVPNYPPVTVPIFRELVEI